MLLPRVDRMVGRAWEETRPVWRDFTPKQRRIAVALGAASAVRPVVRLGLEAADTATRSDKLPSAKRRVGFAALHGVLDVWDLLDGKLARRYGVATPIGAQEALPDKADFFVQECARALRGEMLFGEVATRGIRDVVSTSARCVEDERAARGGRAADVASKRAGKHTTFVRSVVHRARDVFPRSPVTRWLNHGVSAALLVSAGSNIKSFVGHSEHPPGDS